MRFMNAMKFAVFVLVALQITWAAHPFVTDDAGTVSKGSTELEVGVQRGNGWLSTGYPIVHGISDQLDLSVSSGYTISPEDEQGIAPLAFGAKISLIPDMLALTAAADFGASEHALMVTYTKPFADFCWNANAGYESANEGATVNFMYASSVSYTFGMLDCGIEAAGTNDDFTWWQIGTGVTPNSFSRIDAGIGGDFTDSNTLCVSAGITFVISAANKE